MWELAAVTTAVGMGVVFVALFLLSVYMHVFQSITGRLEGRRAPAGKETAAGKAPGKARSGTAEAVSKGNEPTDLGPVVAAVTAALSLHRAKARAPSTGHPPAAGGWRWGGRWASMQGRMSRHERPRPGAAPG
ncbi:MAG: hypothetical protein Kow0092_21840 [Deferrisomatales bacterium]